MRHHTHRMAARHRCRDKPWIDFVEEQRQFRVAGNVRLRAVQVAIDLVENIADVETVAHCGHERRLDASPPAPRILALARNSRNTCTFSVLHTPPFDQCDIARAAMFDVGERRPVEFGDLRQFEYALVDVKKRGVAAEAAGERGRGDAHLGKGGGFRGTRSFGLLHRTARRFSDDCGGPRLMRIVRC